MSGPTEFLAARLGEDEQVARAACEYHDAAWRADPEDAGTLLLWDPMPDSPGFGHTMNERVTAHIARHDPARVLAEVEAKRRTIALHCVRFGTGGDWDTDPAALCNECSVPWPCETIDLLVLPWATHPDYRPEWGV